MKNHCRCSQKRWQSAQQRHWPWPETFWQQASWCPKLKPGWCLEHAQARLSPSLLQRQKQSSLTGHLPSSMRRASATTAPTLAILACERRFAIGICKPRKDAVAEDAANREMALCGHRGVFVRPSIYMSCLNCYLACSEKLF